VAAADDEDEDDDAVDGDTTQSDVASTVQAPRQEVNTVLPQVRPTPSATPIYKPLVTKTGQSKPKFPPVVIQYDRSGAEGAKTRPRIVENK
jgi:hypothetical protein